MKDSAEPVIQNLPPVPAIRLGSRDGDERTHWTDLALAGAVRALAVGWLAQGVMHWAALLTAPGEALSGQSAQYLAAVFFFCVMDFVAAVGLWLLTPWGGVVWLVTVGVQVLAFVLLPNFWSHGILLMLSDAVLVPAYLASAWYAGQRGDRMRKEG